MELTKWTSIQIDKATVAEMWNGYTKKKIAKRGLHKKIFGAQRGSTIDIASVLSVLAEDYDLAYLVYENKGKKGSAYAAILATRNTQELSWHALDVVLKVGSVVGYGEGTSLHHAVLRAALRYFESIDWGEEK